MTLKFLLDTNVISEPLRPEPSRKILEKIQRHETEIGIASVVWHELLFGCSRLPQGKKRSIIERYLADVVAVSIPILDYDRRAAEWHARERTRMEAAGKTPPFVDGQIASIAVVNDLILVTANKSDFVGFKGLKIQTWG